MEKKKQILIIDDDSDILYTTGLVLKKAGFRVETAMDYDEGLEKIRRLPPDLIILDVMMPGKTGFDLAYRLKSEKATAGIPIIMLSAINKEQQGFLTPGIEKKFIPVEEFIDKPADSEDLIKKIRKLLENRK